MTDTLLEQINADREKGTPGAWEVQYTEGCTHLIMMEYPGMKSQMCDETYYPWTPENDADWHRIARVPDMEARIIELTEARARDAETIKAAKELAEAAEVVCAKCESPTEAVTILDQTALRESLAAFNAAQEKNDG